MQKKMLFMVPMLLLTPSIMASADGHRSHDQRASQAGQRDHARDVPSRRNQDAQAGHRNHHRSSWRDHDSRNRHDGHRGNHHRNRHHSNTSLYLGLGTTWGYYGGYNNGYNRGYYGGRYGDDYYGGYGYSGSYSGSGAGTVTGAVVGGLIGSAIDGGRDRTAGTLIGGVLGAVIGSGLERDSYQSQQRYSRDYYRDVPPRGSIYQYRTPVRATYQPYVAREQVVISYDRRSSRDERVPVR